MDISIGNFIKYCMGYIKLTRNRNLASQQKSALDLPKDYFNLGGLLNGDADGKLGELINLETFYSLDPKEVTEETEKEYKKQKELANKIEDAYNKYRNDPFTKQIVCSFGYFEIEIPIIDEEAEDLPEEENGDEESKAKKTKIDRYPLFSIPINIEKDRGKYWVYFVDPDIQVNIGMLEEILGEDLYFQLVEELGHLEIEGSLSLPLTDLEIFTQIWHQIKEKLKHKEANFDEKSFKLEEIKISVSGRANYFLAEDLQKLSKLSDQELQDTALTSWSSDDNLNVETGVPHEQELFFPFLYDKYQLQSLSIIKNKAAIIQGPPGTGKSETIANILCHLAATGNKVLFVSQKAQALKVVKDKLKKLNVKYLFGYLPNPNSAQLNEEDEVDGVAPQLAGLESHIANLGYKYYPRRKLLEYEGDGSENQEVTLDNLVSQKQTAKKNFNETIGAQRKIYQLNEELHQLSVFDIELQDYDCFNANLTYENFKIIKDTQQDLHNLKISISGYQSNKKKIEFDGMFKHLNLQKASYSHTLKQVREDVAKSGYDRHSNLMRKFNNTLRNMRLKKLRASLPMEIIDVVDEGLAEDAPRSQTLKAIDALIDHCNFYENIEKFAQTKNKLETDLYACGITTEQLDALEKIINSRVTKNLNDIKTKITRVHEIKKELAHLYKHNNDLNDLNVKLKKSALSQREQVALYIQNIINKNIIEKWKKGITIKQIINKLAKAFGKSKKAYKTFDNLRKDSDNFNAILDLIPIWIMELDDASRIIPLEPGIFDYVILDEASQCNTAYTLPAMFRAKHALFVGDSEQMRDNTVMFKSNRSFDELSHRYQIPEELQIKATGSSVQSVLDIAKLRGLMSAFLRYHYRSPRELIGFSNKNFYRPRGKELIALNNNYLTYQQTNRVLITHYTEPEPEGEISDKVNVAEAQGILELFKELRSDEKYREKSIGILSFFNAQAAYIRQLFEDSGYKEEEDNYKVSIIEGIQGDEKDIILYSFVIRSLEQKNKYIALTGESGDIRADINRGRVNVAFSRARQQVHCFVSMPPKEFPEGVWIKKYLEYVEENGVVDFFSTELQPFDSYFEEEFYALAKTKLKKHYIIQNQVKSCGFKIDFVMTDTISGKKVAVECDGPCHFKDELDEEYGIHIESDEERQAVLEAAGWEFYRIKYSDWINKDFNREKVFEDLAKELR